MTPQEVPEEIKLWITLFPECYDRARAQHRATEDGYCRSCGDDSPCKFERWLDCIPNPSRTI